MLWTPAFFRAPEQNYENQTAQKALALHVYSHFSITQDNEGRRGQKSLKYWQYWDSKGLVDTNTDNEASACHSTETGSKSSARPEQAPAFVHVPPRLCKWLVLPKKFKWISYFYFSDVSVQVPRGWAMAGTSSSSWAARAAPSLSWAQKPHRNPSWERRETWKFAERNQAFISEDDGFVLSPEDTRQDSPASQAHVQPLLSVGVLEASTATTRFSVDGPFHGPWRWRSMMVKAPSLLVHTLKASGQGRNEVEANLLQGPGTGWVLQWKETPASFPYIFGVQRISKDHRD